MLKIVAEENNQEEQGQRVEDYGSNTSRDGKGRQLRGLLREKLQRHARAAG